MSTAQTFSDKWHKNPALAFDQTLNEDSEIFKWIINRNGFPTGEQLRDFLSSKKRILDAGCGNGRVTALLRKYSSPDETHVTGVDLVAFDVASENLKNEKNVSIFQGDLSGDLSNLGTFDFIYCQEVLHHLPDPKKGFINLVSILDKGGELAIYVYKKKAPVREFTDDYVRNAIKDLPYEEAMKVCDEFTAFGKSLADQKIKVRVPELKALEIKAGEYDLQRFIYHFFMKCFWNDEFSFHENAVINFDWYHPQDCSRHTLEEVRGWFEENKLTVVQEHEDFYGITMRGKKN